MENTLIQQESDDINYHLHPYTNARKHQEQGPLVIVKGDGVYVEDIHGKKYLEAMAGLWSVALGFSEKRLVQAAMRQFEILPFYHQFTHKTHDVAAQFAKRLIDIAPVPMSKVFFTNSGSEANDTVIKLVWYRSNALGLPNKKKIISRLKGYHGVTVASASLTGLPGNHRGFDLPIDRILHTACPHYWRDAQEGESEEQFSTRMAEELENLIRKEGPETIAAFIAEPVMGAGGVIVPPATYWEKIQAVLNKHDILFIADEVICGFGRTGKMFASETFGLKPDVLVLSKQISSSYQPLSAILLNEKMFNPIADESNKLGVLGHGFTAGGHPVAVAVGMENLNIIQERKLVENAATVGAHMLKRLHELDNHPLVGEVRGIGLIAGVELVIDKSKKTALEVPGQLGTMVGKVLQDLGVISRNIGDTLAFCPPLIITVGQVDEMVSKFKQALDIVHEKLNG
ncbi:aspartate aminotransferase family protein [Advenella faeciporci]|uniref:Aspartate aminotransferase family protein n=1 Tax=Advenella faeciporci TaxID=797535 RepID=A0A918JJF1_9BURK|nr:aspartate aminotransferase family protein [Advenella faeciporci]GGW84179.1 aspartate aminotransferase family protein [Advenella faeciporci]